MISVPQLGQEQVSRWENTSAIVGEYRSIYPSPETEQYLVFDQNVLARQEKIEQRWCSTTDGYGSRGRANLRNFVDAAIMNWKERMMSPWNWYYIHADGWHINFWEDNFWLCKQSDTDCLRPIASIDIRQVFSVGITNDSSSAEGITCPWEIHLHFQTGYYPFRVKTADEAQAWRARIMMGVVESVKIGQARVSYMHKLHLHDEVEPHRIEKDPARLDRIRSLWHKCVEAVENGVRPSRQVFFDLYRAYDALDTHNHKVETPQHHPGLPAPRCPITGAPLIEHEIPEAGQGDGNLTYMEIEVMARELLEVKIEEVKQIVVQQEKVLFSSHRPVGAYHEVKLRWTIDQGRALLDHYEQMLNPQTFFDRVVNFHHRTDISREGRVDVTEFMNAAPVFLFPVMELNQEGSFFRAAMQSDLGEHKATEEEHANLHAEGKTRAQKDAECNQQ